MDVEIMRLSQTGFDRALANCMDRMRCQGLSAHLGILQNDDSA